MIEQKKQELYDAIFNGDICWRYDTDENNYYGSFEKYQLVYHVKEADIIFQDDKYTFSFDMPKELTENFLKWREKKSYFVIWSSTDGIYEIHDSLAVVLPRLTFNSTDIDTQIIRSKKDFTDFDIHWGKSDPWDNFRGEWAYNLKEFRAPIADSFYLLFVDEEAVGIYDTLDKAKEASDASTNWEYSEVDKSWTAAAEPGKDISMWNENGDKYYQIFHREIGESIAP